MTESSAAQTMQYIDRDRDTAPLGHAKADSIVADADRRSATPVAEFRNVSLDKMDKVAAVVAAIMTIGPLFAAFVGRLHQ